MPPAQGRDPQRDWGLEPFREYLLLLAQRKIPNDLKARLDPSDLVHETILRAHQARDQFRGETEGERAAWLRQILTFRLIDELRRLDHAPRVSINQDMEESSRRLADLLPGDDSAPSARLRGEERAVEVAKLLARLSPSQAEAIVLRHCEGWAIDRICEHMGKTPDAVGGLLRHGMKRLRELTTEELA